MPWWAHPQNTKRLQLLCKRFFYWALHTICTQHFFSIFLKALNEPLPTEKNDLFLFLENKILPFHYYKSLPD